MISITDQNGNAITSASNIANVNPIRYRGYYYDAEIGMYYLQSRYYDSQVGRFINADDSCMLNVGSTVKDYNLFEYCSNNPVSERDSSGNMTQRWKNVAKVAGVCAFVIAVAVASVATGGAAGFALSTVAWAGAFGAVYGFTVGAIKDVRQFGWNSTMNNASDYCASYSLSFMFNELTAQVAIAALSKLTAKALTSIDSLLKNYCTLYKHKGSTWQYTRNKISKYISEYKCAVNDFNKLKSIGLKDVKKFKTEKGSGYSGTLGNIKVNVRSYSSYGAPTIEFKFPSNKVIKIRYQK